MLGFATKKQGSKSAIYLFRTLPIRINLTNDRPSHITPNTLVVSKPFERVFSRPWEGRSSHYKWTCFIPNWCQCSESMMELLRKSNTHMLPIAEVLVVQLNYEFNFLNERCFFIEIINLVDEKWNICERVIDFRVPYCPYAISKQNSFLLSEN